MAGKMIKKLLPLLDLQIDRLKIGFLLIIACSFVFIFVVSKQVEYATEKELKVKSGLKVKGKQFTLEGEPFRIMSGAMHYFRIPRGYWNDRMLKAKAMGLNTIETYIPWNMHEPEPGVYDFEGDLSLIDFVNLAQIFGLYVIIRPGPYICAEWDLGGLPSWLLQDPNMELRSMYEPFIKAVDNYFDMLMPILRALQHSRGGPVIAFQIENEYGSFDTDLEYMNYLKKAFTSRGIKELLFTSDNGGGLGKVPLPGVLQTINLQTKVNETITQLENIQPNKPVFVTEFWCGWFDHWGEDHHIVKTSVIAAAFKHILDHGASFNLYMFHGGTNFGFMNGANTVSKGKGYTPTISSYDYDAPVAETGDLTEKYHVLREVLLNYAPKTLVPVSLPWVPDSLGRKIYGKIKLNSYMPLKDIIKQVKNAVVTEDVLPMEMLAINNGAGQSYGYILYSTVLPENAHEVTIFNAADRLTVLVDDIVIKEVKSLPRKLTVKLPSLESGKKHVLKILVENCGRINYENAINDQRKGIRGHVAINGKKHRKWKTYPLEFKPDFLSRLEKSPDWSSDPPKTIKTPAVYKGMLFVDRAPHDGMLHIKGFDRGAVFLNRRNIGRFDKRGPQETLYVPSMFLRSGENTVILFEQGTPSSSLEIDSVLDPIFGKTVHFQI